jgi:hypothetical protein
MTLDTGTMIIINGVSTITNNFLIKMLCVSGDTPSDSNANGETNNNT